ncbi:MAG: hypothetical protein P8N56_02065 [Schleiferiaceae bacterium]|nr:hypothetical protein [Schleiferiaceae bacterium]
MNLSTRSGGRRCALLFLLCTSLHGIGQVTVINGLSHFSPCDQALAQHITLYNASDSPRTVFIEIDSTDQPKALLSIASEKVLAPGERLDVPFEWMSRDTLPHFVQLLIYENAQKPVKHLSGWTIQTQIHYAVQLYYGCLCGHPRSEVQARWGEHLEWSTTSDHYWIAKSQAYSSDGRALGPAQDLFLAPFGQPVEQTPPSEAAYVIAFDEKGNHIGIRRHANRD